MKPLKQHNVKNDPLKEKLLHLAYYQKHVSTCSHILVICIDTAFGADDIDAYFDREKQIRVVSEAIVGKFRQQLKVVYSKKTKK